MRKTWVASLAVAILACAVVSGCGASKTASSGEAIEKAKVMETVQQKTDYLVGQAKSFYNSKEFQESINVAQYVLRYLDKDSAQAKDLLEQAKSALTAQLQNAAADVKKGFAGFGK